MILGVYQWLINCTVRIDWGEMTICHVVSEQEMATVGADLSRNELVGQKVGRLN